MPQEIVWDNDDELVSPRAAQVLPIRPDVKTNPHEVKPLRDVLQELVKSTETPERVVSLPFPTLTHYLDGGLRPGELILLAARPRIGKSAMAIQCAVHAADLGTSTLIVSREMKNVAQARRMVSQHSQVRASHLKQHAQLSQDEWRRAVTAIDYLSGLSVYLTERANSVKNIEYASRMVPHCGLLIVDYLQLLEGPSGVFNPRARVEAVSRGLKDMALRLNIPVVALCSVSRPDKAQRTKNIDERPTIHDLRESGSLESDADIVLILHRRMHGSEQDKTVAECNIAKSREGADGRCAMLNFKPEFVAFEEQMQDQPEFFS